MPKDQDLFAEEQSMVTMSFGDHIEELRVRLILALIGLFVGVLIVFVPPLNIGWRVMKKMEEPAKVALAEFYKAEYDKKKEKADQEKAISPQIDAVVERMCWSASSARSHRSSSFRKPESLKGPSSTCPMQFFEAGVISMNIANDRSDRPEPRLACPARDTDHLSSWCVSWPAWCSPAHGSSTRSGRSSPRGSIATSGTTSRNTCRSPSDCFWRVCFSASCLSCPITLQFLLQFNVWLGVAPTFG